MFKFKASLKTSPLMVTEFLHRTKDIFIDYFGKCNVAAIKEDYVIVYELLDEVLDAGFPLATEPNILKALIKPSSMLRAITNTVTGESIKLVQQRTKLDKARAM